MATQPKGTLIDNTYILIAAICPAQMYTDQGCEQCAEACFLPSDKNKLDTCSYFWYKPLGFVCNVLFGHPIV